jgi:glutaconate CoA-transferase, subunit A
MGSVAAAALCSRRIIVSCEELVDHEVIRSSPHLTILPAYRVDAVMEVPWGAHPTEVLGYYNQDRLMYGLFVTAAATGEGLKAWLDEWVYGCKNREAYLSHYIASFGEEFLAKLKAQPYLSAPANYGSAFTSSWDEEGRERSMGITREELEDILKEKGLIYE